MKFMSLGCTMVQSTQKSRSTEPLARPFANSLSLLTRWLYSADFAGALRRAVLIHSMAHSLKGIIKR